MHFCDDNENCEDLGQQMDARFMQYVSRVQVCNSLNDLQMELHLFKGVANLREVLAGSSVRLNIASAAAKKRGRQ